MKIQIASDLHLESLVQRFPIYRVVEPTDADVLIIAGDIHAGTKAIGAFSDWPVPVVYVHGNHETYDEEYFDVIEKMRTASANSNVHYLEQEEWRLNKVRFLGCCMWTDYRLYSEDTALAMSAAHRGLNDHRLIRRGDRPFTAQDALELHQQSRAWLAGKLAEQFDGVTVVITHHGPHPKSIHPRYADAPINAAFISDLTPLMGKADLWIHGHVHDSFDYEISGTRVIANPRGYARNRSIAQSPEKIEWENVMFNPRLVVDLNK